MLVDLWLKVGTIQIKLKKLTNQFNLEIQFGFHFFIFSFFHLSVQFSSIEIEDGKRKQTKL